MEHPYVLLADVDQPDGYLLGAIPHDIPAPFAMKNPPSMPMLGGDDHGFFALPKQRSLVAILLEVGGKPVATVSAPRDRTKLPSGMSPGESLQCASDGRTVSWLKNTAGFNSDYLLYSGDFSNATVLLRNGDLPTWTTFTSTHVSTWLFSGHVIFDAASTARPTAAPLTNAGSASGATAGIQSGGVTGAVRPQSSDQRGRLTLRSGASALAVGDLVQVTFGLPTRSEVEPIIVVWSNDGATDALGVLRARATGVAGNTLGFVISAANAPAASTTYVINYGIWF